MVSGVNPNLLLIFFVFVVFLGVRLRFLVMLIFLFLTLTFFWLPFWFLPNLILAIIAATAYFSKIYLTGNKFGDFLTVIFAGTVIFYLAQALFTKRIFAGLIFEEVVYNLLLGFVLWFFLNFLIERLEKIRF